MTIETFINKLNSSLKCGNIFVKHIISLNPTMDLFLVRKIVDKFKSSKLKKFF